MSGLGQGWQVVPLRAGLLQAVEDLLTGGVDGVLSLSKDLGKIFSCFFLERKVLILVGGG